MSFLKHFFPTSRTTKLEEEVEHIKTRLFKPEPKNDDDGSFSYRNIFRVAFSSFYTHTPSVEERIDVLHRNVNLILQHLKVDVQHEVKDEFRLKSKPKKGNK